MSWQSAKGFVQGCTQTMSNKSAQALAALRLLEFRLEIAAISEAFKIVNTNMLEAEQRKQLQAIRTHLDSLEDGGAQVIDV